MSAPLVLVAPQATQSQGELLMLAGAVSTKNYEAIRTLIADKPEPRP